MENIQSDTSKNLAVAAVDHDASYSPVHVAAAAAAPDALPHHHHHHRFVNPLTYLMNPLLLQAVLEELRELGRMAVPLTAMNCVVYVRAMVSVLCLGRLGTLELAGGALSVGFTNITGYSVLFGLASGMDPVCSQAFGSENWALISLSLQRTILLLLCACIPIAILWLSLHHILLALGQDPSITRVASIYCFYSLPDLLANSLLQPLRVFLRSQGYTTPMMWCSLLAVTLHIPLSIVLVFVLELGVPGMAIAAAWTNFHMVIFILAYISASGSCRKTWRGWSLDCFRGWSPLLHLALPSCFAICLEWWWYEVLTILAGYLPNPRDSMASTSILIQTTSFMYTFPLALSSSVSARIGKELGAVRPGRARVAAWVALACAGAIGIVNLAWTTLLRHAWGRVFTHESGVLVLTASAMPIVGLCELGNCPQTTGCGVLRGSARPVVGARINLGSFYLVGMPVALGLAFWPLGLGFVGLWLGLLAAQAACVWWVLGEVWGTDWEQEAMKARRLVCAGAGSDGEGLQVGEAVELRIIGAGEARDKARSMRTTSTSSGGKIGMPSPPPAAPAPAATTTITAAVYSCTYKKRKDGEEEDLALLACT